MGAARAAGRRRCNDTRSCLHLLLQIIATRLRGAAILLQLVATATVYHMGRGLRLAASGQRPAASRQPPELGHLLHGVQIQRAVNVREVFPVRRAVG